MSDQLVECPKCGNKFPLANVLRHGIEDDVRKDLTRRFAEKEKGLIADFSRKEKELAKKERELDDVRENLDERVKAKVAAEGERLKERALKDAQEEFSSRFREQGEKLQRTQDKLKEAQEKEIETRKLKEEAEEAKREVELTIGRRLEEERGLIREKVAVEEAEKWEAQVKAKEEEIARIKRDLDRAQRVGVSGELAGEVAEKTLEERLRSTFDEDQVDPIGRGKEGADVIQLVHGGGSLLWESKDRYPHWSKEWIPKLKRDRDESKASVGLLVSTVGPDGKPLRGPVHEDGVVITPPWAVVGVASMLRPHLQELARQRRLYAKQETLQAAVYAWVTSEDFQRGVSAILENLARMQNRVSRAKVNVSKWFRHMGDDVDETMRSLAEFYGSAQSHARLPDLPALALNAEHDEGTEITDDRDT
ncbi:MAG TPA: DUF2130 domain-containing protein [Thermoplasmata archaeon]|nr:DUF2130 domain-containing protein [Thermoplasmata archaeon]